MGDVVGYGADAATCVNLVRLHCTATVLGNHDEAVALERGVKTLPRDARKAAAHNRVQLNESQRAFLAGLPLTLNFVVHRHNLHHLEDMIDLAVELDAHRVEVAHVQYYGWALINRAALMPTRQQLDAAAAIVAAIEKVLRESDVKTPDMGGKANTKEMGQAVVDAL